MQSNKHFIDIGKSDIHRSISSTVCVTKAEPVACIERKSDTSILQSASVEPLCWYESLLNGRLNNILGKERGALRYNKFSHLLLCRR